MAVEAKNSTILGEYNSFGEILDADQLPGCNFKHLPVPDNFVGEIKTQMTVYNHTDYTVTYANRQGLTFSLQPMGRDDFVKTGLASNSIYRGPGVYVKYEYTIDNWSAIEMCRYYKRLLENNNVNEVFKNNRVFMHLYEQLYKKWVDYLKPFDVGYAHNRNTLHTGFTYRQGVKHTIVFFLAETHFNQFKAFYDMDTDMTYTRYDLDARLYHPVHTQFDPTMGELLLEEYTNDMVIERFNLLSSKDHNKVLYRRAGEMIYKIKVNTKPSPRNPYDNILIHTCLDMYDNGSYDLKVNHIDLNDKEALAKIGIYQTLDEAQVANSNVEISVLKSRTDIEKAKLELEKNNVEKEILQLKRQMAEQEQKYKEQEQKHKETVNQLQLEIQQLKVVEIKESNSDKQNEREFNLTQRQMDEVVNQETRELKREEITAKKEDRIEEKQIKREEREMKATEMVYGEKIKRLEAETKLSETQMKTQVAMSNAHSSDIANTATIVGGAATLGTIIYKVLTSNKSKNFTEGIYVKNLAYALLKDKFKINARGLSHQQLAIAINSSIKANPKLLPEGVGLTVNKFTEIAIGIGKKIGIEKAMVGALGFKAATSSAFLSTTVSSFSAANAALLSGATVTGAIAAIATVGAVCAIGYGIYKCCKFIGKLFGW